MSRKSDEQMERDEQEFYRIQELVLNAETIEERTKYAWEMYPIIKSAMASALKKRANNHVIYDYENTLEELTTTLVERFIKRPQRYQYFKTLIYYKSIDYWLPKYREHLSLDSMLDDGGGFDRLAYCMDEETGCYTIANVE